MSFVEHPMQTIFALCYRPGPAWLAGKRVFEQPLAGHLAYMRSLHDAGKIVVGGPYTDDSGGMVAVEADSHEAALEILEGDPAIEDGVMVGDVHPWRILAGRSAQLDRYQDLRTIGDRKRDLPSR
jgi:uncharacterized protein YciI